MNRVILLLMAFLKKIQAVTVGKGLQGGRLKKTEMLLLFLKEQIHLCKIGHRAF